MSAFDKVIGYETIKNELLQICDMIHNQHKFRLKYNQNQNIKYFSLFPPK